MSRECSVTFVLKVHVTCVLYTLYFMVEHIIQQVKKSLTASESFEIMRVPFKLLKRMEKLLG